MRKMTCLFAAALALLILAPQRAEAQMPAPPGQVAEGEQPKHEAYLFAHMLKEDYGRLYYSVSTDGLHWTMLNGRQRIFDDYRGHPDICLGPDGRYYLVGNPAGDRPIIHFWVSDDLVSWEKFSEYRPELDQVPNYPTPILRVGAPKLYFDEPSGKFLLTWHTPHDMGPTDLPEPYWASQRTLYVTSSDLKTFDGPPKKLFGFDMATIDTIIRKIGDRYYAFIKDERYPSLDWPTGKTIRVCSSENLLGPYTEPGPPISPNFSEAPTLIPSPDGTAWYCYYEEYPGVRYRLSAGASPEGPWFQVFGDDKHPEWDKFDLPNAIRHGGMMTITRQQHDTLVKAFPPSPEEDEDPEGER